MINEEWRALPEYGKYEVSNLGRVRSHCRQTIIRVPLIDRHGYHVYDLWRDGQRRKVRVHILVAQAFTGPRPEGLDIRHLDGNPGNNHVENLAYGTRSENLRDAVRHGRNRQAAQTHCKHGHEYTAENTIPFGPDGRRRSCRMCSARRKRAYYARHFARPLPVQTACRKAGHDWTDPHNVYVQTNGSRCCAVCSREARRNSKKKAS